MDRQDGAVVSGVVWRFACRFLDLARCVWIALFGRRSEPWLASKPTRCLRRKASNTIDLAPLNGGNWTIACLFGGYTHPTREVGTAASIRLIDRLRFFAFDAFTLRIGEVDEYEAVIAYVDASGKAAFLFFDKVGAENAERCIRKPITTITLTGYLDLRALQAD